MKIKFLKDYRYPGGGYSNKGDVQTFEDTEFVKWAIDNGFAEEVKESGWWKPKKEPTWVRKQIKQIEFGEHKSVYVVVRFVKSQNYICHDNEFGDVVGSNERGEVKEILFSANEAKFWRQEDCDILNQMIRDGYIEIQDNPNIVWEDENGQ